MLHHSSVDPCQPIIHWGNCWDVLHSLHTKIGALWKLSQKHVYHTSIILDIYSPVCLLFNAMVSDYRLEFLIVQVASSESLRIFHETILNLVIWGYATV